MLDGPSVVAALKDCGVTHVVWLPDSELGTWEAALTGPAGLPLVRVCREGEAMAVAAGLTLGGKKPVVMIQCTGLFESGDALRNDRTKTLMPSRPVKVVRPRSVSTTNCAARGLYS